MFSPEVGGWEEGREGVGTPVLRSLSVSLSDGDNRRIFVCVWNFSFRDVSGKNFFSWIPWLKKGFFWGGGGREEAGGGGYSSILEKQMRKIYDQFGTMPSNETQTLKFPLLRFVSSNPLLKKKSRKSGMGFLGISLEAWGVKGDTTALFAAQKPLLYLSIINIVKNAVPHPNA